MEEIHNLCEKLRVDRKVFLKLASEIKIIFASDRLNFAESCDALLCLLHFTLLWDISINVQSIVHGFFLKWFDCHNGDLDGVISFVSPSHKITSLGSIILLYNHVFPNLPTTIDFRDILTWKTKETTHQWLEEYISSDVNSFELLNDILVQSLDLSHNPVLDIHNNDYVKSLSQFLNACHKYLLKNYEVSIDILSSINDENCSAFLLGMINLFIGLNLQRSEKLQSSLIKYKYSFGCSNNCWLSIYLAARVFRKLHKIDACIEALKLLRQVNIEEEPRDLSFHGLLLHYHFPKEPHFQITVEWLLGTSYLEQQQYKMAQEHFSKVYLQHPKVTILNPSPMKSLLMTCDQFPKLPDFDCIKVEYAITLMHLKEYEQTEVMLNDLEVAFDQNQEDLDNYQELNKLVKAVSQLLVAEASFHLTKLDKSKNCCAKLVFYFEMQSYSPSNAWAKVYHLIKSCLYKLIATIANTQIDKDNTAHYRRLERQSIDLWHMDDDFLLIEMLNDDCEWIRQNIINYYENFNL